MKKSQKFLPVTCHLLLVTVLLLVTCYSSLVTAADWSGVDESVVEKYAEEHGRAPRAPFINTDQGDLLLFMFLIGGVIGGFAAGYYWRTLTEDRTKTAERRKENVSGNV
jgi:ABC-type cobalt transport system substrate-binding protein